MANRPWARHRPGRREVEGNGGAPTAAGARLIGREALSGSWLVVMATPSRARVARALRERCGLRPQERRTSRNAGYSHPAGTFVARAGARARSPPSGARRAAGRGRLGRTLVVRQL